MNFNEKERRESSLFHILQLSHKKLFTNSPIMRGFLRINLVLGAF